MDNDGHEAHLATAKGLIESTGLVRACVDLTRMTNLCLRENDGLTRPYLSVVCYLSLHAEDEDAPLASEIARGCDLSYAVTTKAIAQGIRDHMVTVTGTDAVPEGTRHTSSARRKRYSLTVRGLKRVSALLRHCRAELPSDSVLSGTTLSVLAAGAVLVDGNGYPRREGVACLLVVSAGGDGITTREAASRLGIERYEASTILAKARDHGHAYLHQPEGLWIATEDGIAFAYRVASTFQDLGTTRGFKHAWSAAEIGAFALVGEGEGAA